ncbi:MAG: TonB-dependent receptor [Crocinitomicaceae bacterium]|nr:TonB-dependent receptor [Flavobacteriales bacterium]NQZ36510.1 TonB-dependent receptor [Crocinitomicaceae bacterium]
MKSIVSIFALLLIAFGSNAQNAQVSGILKSNDDGLPMIGMKIELTPAETPLRARTDEDGVYSIENVPFGEYRMVISGLNVDTMVLDVDVDETLFVFDIYHGKTLDQEEVEVIAQLVKGRRTPVAVSNIGTKEINEELGSQDLPMILNSKPGVHATQQGGGDGDARITIRGFDQRNVGVMIDGVPVNDMENGAVYWSNWFGLDQITSQIQLQRGLGATKLAMPSVGGTMNILTMSTGGKRKIKVRQEYGSGNFLRTSVSYKSGTLKNGWGILFSGSYKQGDGWVDGLSTQGGFYYLKVQKRFKKHVLSLSGFGAPQQHAQRSYSQQIEYWDSDYASSLGIPDSTFGTVRDRGLRFNQHWGYRTVDGKQTILNERRNYYHKPQITLKDFWKVNKKLSWSNMAYVSIGRGGGERFFNSGSNIIYNDEGQVDWDTMVYNNKYKTFGGVLYSTADGAYHPTKLKSSQIMAAAVNNHFWMGGLSQFDYKMNPDWSFSGGLDYRFYKGTHYYVITDLLGGDYFVNNADENASTSMKVVGDRIGRQPYHNDRDGIVQWAGGFGQAEYAKGRWSTFLNVSTVTNFYRGVDRFLGKQMVLSDTILEIAYADTITYNGETYTRDSEGLIANQTEWASKTGYTFKTGANYNLNEKMNVFANVGYLSRTPQFSNVIDNTRNRIFDTLLNENIIAFELGYGFTTKKFSANLNGYYTRWENRPLPFGLTVQDPNDPLETVSVNVPGMDALHMGAELDFAYRVSKKLTFEGMVSMGDWKWQSNETVFVPGGDSVTFFARGVHVGNSAQSTYAASVRWGFLKTGYIKVKYTFFDRYYSNFEPNSLSIPDPELYELVDPTDIDQGYQDLDGNVVEFEKLTGRESWKIPGYGLMSVHAGYRLRMKRSALNFRINVFNVLNTLYISDARNNFSGNGFDAGSAAVFVGQGVRFNVSVGFEF